MKHLATSHQVRSGEKLLATKPPAKTKQPSTSAESRCTANRESSSRAIVNLVCTADVVRFGPGSASGLVLGLGLTAGAKARGAATVAAAPVVRDEGAPEPVLEEAVIAAEEGAWVGRGSSPLVETLAMDPGHRAAATARSKERALLAC